MSQPVKLSDALVLDARIAGEAQERSIAGQVEFWAKLGRGAELLLGGKQVLALCRSAGATPLSQLVNAVDTAKGHQSLKAYLESEPFPYYEPYPGEAGFLIRTEEDGSKVVGKFLKRIFVPDSSKLATAKKRKSVGRFAREVHDGAVKASVPPPVHSCKDDPETLPLLKDRARNDKSNVVRQAAMQGLARHEAAKDQKPALLVPGAIAAKSTGRGKRARG
ncbi:MAG: hypothetical protein ABR907_07050 [Terracidiphilus sp.]|jgi:hypothetical protein